MNLKSLLAATALCSVLVVPAYAQTAPKMREVLKIWNLEKPSPSTQFVTKSVSEDRTVLENVVFKDPETNRVDVTFGQLVLQRQPSTGAKAGQPAFNVTMENGVAMSDKQEKTTIGKVEIVGLNPSSNLGTLVNWLNDRSGPSASGQAPTEVAFEGDVKITDVVSETKDSNGKLTQNKVGAVHLLGITLKPDGILTQTLEMTNFEVRETDTVIKMGKLTFSDFKSLGWQNMRSSTDFKAEDFDFKNLSLGSIVANNITMDITSKDENAEAETTQIGVDQIELRNWTDKKIAKIGLAGLTVAGGQAEKRVTMNLESFALEDVNVAYFAAIGAALTKIAPTLEQKSKGGSALLGMVELASETAAVAASAGPASKPAAPAAKAIASPKLKDVLPGGPLDNGIGAISLSKFGFEAQGFRFTIDNIATKTARNADGIIVKSSLEPMTMKLTVPQALLDQPNSPVAMFAPLISDGIELVIGAKATYDPVTDLATFNELNYTFKGWAGINMEMSFDGLSKFYREQTVEALMAPSVAEIKKDKDPKSKNAKKEDPMAELKQIASLYQGVRLINAAVELRDFGGIGKAAGVFASMMAAPNKAATSRAATQDAQMVAQIRQSWAQPLRDQAGQKNKSALERQFLLSLARWIEIGGVMTTSVQPPTPLELNTLTDSKDLQTKLGLSFSNQPAAKN